jgi:hypothetical protein
MSLRRTYFGTGLGLGTFCIGLAFIVAASVLNIAHDRFSRAEYSALPEGIARLYEGVGKTGVTVILVTTGVMVMLIGFLNSSGHESRTGTRGSRAGGTGVPATPYFCTGNPNAPQTPPGRVALETRKYVSAALSGVPGWDSAQRKAPQS